MSDKAFSSFVNDGERMLLAEAQDKTIVNQSKRITQLEAEVNHLMLKLKQAALPASQQASPIVSMNDEENIARMELRKLRDTCLVRELTMEETRKVEIYAKLLNTLNNPTKKLVIDTKKLNSEQLLSALTDGTDEES
jgi:hypothetical protein